MKRFKARGTYLLFLFILSVFLVTGCGGGGGIDETGHWLPNSDTTLPTVTLTVPANGATAVAINTKISATFSEAMDPLTITAAEFTVKQGATAVAGTVTYTGVTAVFAPASALAFSTTYTATITTGAKDPAGNALASNYVWSFTTGAAPDTTAPTVTLTVPASAATGVLTNTKVSATFSEAMDPLTITTAEFTVKQGTTTVAGTVIYAGVTAVFSPASALAFSTTYTATITTGAKDLAGNALASNYVWSFTTGAAPDTTAPTVTLTVPANAATGVLTNTKVSATFSEAMDPLTITNLTFTIKQGTTAVAGTVVYAGVTAVFSPASVLAFSTTYTATITTVAKDLAGNALASNYVWSFTTGAAPDTTAPTVTLTVPANAATGVLTNTKVSATFSEAMDPLTITNLTFTIKQGTTAVSGTVVYAGVTAVFSPASVLAFSTTYTATITTVAKDLAGNALASNYVWSFTTGAAPDTTAPRVILTVPANAATGVLTNTTVTATFSEAMDPLTITNLTFTLKQGTTAVSGTVVYSGITAVFTPGSILAANTTYTATITTGAKDLALPTGNALASNYVWSFTTGAAMDTTRPTVTLTVPAAAATDVNIRTRVTATFSEEMDPLTITTATFTLKDGVTPFSGTVTHVGRVATFIPVHNLATNTTYTATITTGAKDLAGNQLAGNQAPLPAASDYVWSFTTGSDIDVPPAGHLGPEPPDLGVAQPFGFLSSAALVNTGLSTVITGDAAGTTSTASSITGFHDGGGNVFTTTLSNNGSVTGTIYASDAPTPGNTTSAAARAAATLAFIYARDLPGGLNVQTNSLVGAGGLAGELGNRTLAPGLYKSTVGSYDISIGDLTLDPLGDANAVWIFQMPASTLKLGDTVNVRNVILLPPGQAKNVFWQVGSAATISGVTGGGTMVGTILSNATTTFSTDGQASVVTLEGRALVVDLANSGIGATMNNTVVNVPAP